MTERTARRPGARTSTRAHTGARPSRGVPMGMIGTGPALVLAPHTDDGEFGCGATIARLRKEDVDVVYVAFSAAEESVPAGLPRDTLRHEVKAATSVLGIPSEQCLVLDFKVRTFPSARQEILETMVELNRTYQPSVVFLPSPNDTHQDHAVVAAEGFRAFKRTTMLGYELPWNNLDFRTSCFVNVDEAFVQNKCDALARYVSQRHRSYASEEFVRALALMRGTQIGQRYAEAFEVIRWVIA